MAMRQSAGRASFLATVSTVTLLLGTSLALAQQVQEEATAQNVSQPASRDDSNVFHLGQLNVVAPGGAGTWGNSGHAISESTVSAEEMFTFDRNRLDDALTLVPGVTISQGGSRNEPLISVRGFTRFQVPLYIDGIRVYLPYDNRIDFGRFITPDLSEIQVQKGYVSVLNGPGGMGGAINLVTRRPTREVEGEIRAGIELGNTGTYSSFNTMGSLGTKQEKYYLQAAGSVLDSNGWFLPGGFQPENYAAQGTGLRDFSDTRDWRVNLKAGYTPNETDEYTINYTAQQGSKAAPYDIYNRVRTPWGVIGPKDGSIQRNWNWPEWNYSSVYFLSRTELSEKAAVNTRVYYNKFKNTLSSFDDSSFTTQTSRDAFNSLYDDNSYGADLELIYKIDPRDTMKIAFTYRRDDHKSENINSPGLLTSTWDPDVRDKEDVMSLGFENTVHFTPDFDFIAGVSYEYRDLLEAQDYSSRDGLFNHPLTTEGDINWQFAAIYRLSETGQVNASVSSRTRFPTLFERFSSRFGRSIANPDLQSERATNYELGWRDTFNGNLALSASVFYSQITNLIESANTNQWSNQYNQWVTQNQNVGDSDNYGIELTAEWTVSDTLLVGGNYSFVKVDITSPTILDIKPVGQPEHLAFLYAKWRAVDKLTLIPSLQLSSSRYTNMSSGNVDYVKTSGFALANVSAEYQFNENTTFTAGMKNVFDSQYQTEYLFPQAGRSFYLNGRFVF